jgi:hypothetical protein
MNINQYFHSLDGEHKNTDACLYCTADAEIKSEGANIFVMSVAHEDHCPLWQVIQAQERDS